MDDQQRVMNEDGRIAWDEKAAFWDELHGDEGNVFHRTLVSPAVERLLALTPGERVLDIACGSGQMARRIAALGGKVTAVDFSAALIERAKARSVATARGGGQSAGEPIQYGVADATDEEALAALGEGQFDAVINTLAVMDMPVIAPLFRAARRLLRPGGRLVIATAHPAFNSNNPIFVSEMADEDGQLVIRHMVKIGGYLDVPPVKGVGAPGEPTSHYYYHRTFTDLLGEAFAAGLVVDGLEEPGFPRIDPAEAKPISWFSVWQIPPVLAVRLRVS